MPPVLRGRIALAAAWLSGCGGPPLALHVNDDWHRYAEVRTDDSARGHLQFKSEVCSSYDLGPDRSTLNEASIVRLLEAERLVVQVQRQPVVPPAPELVFVFVTVPGLADPVALRVAILRNADEAGRALHEAIHQRGPGSWGVRRSNVAVLGPNGSTGDDIAFAAKTTLACWGEFTMRASEDAVVVSGGYAEP
jgi:hypothetical protein